MGALVLQYRDNRLQVAHGPGQPIDAGDNKGLAGVDEVENGLQFRASVQGGAAAGLIADHGAARSLKRLHLGVQGLVRRRDPGIADPGAICGVRGVHFGCASDMICSITRCQPKIDRKLHKLVFICRVIQSVLIMTFLVQGAI